MKSPIALLDSLLIDFKRLNPGVKGLDRDLKTVKRRFKHEGEGFLTQALPSLDAALLRAFVDKRFTCPIGFKKIRGGAIPVFLSGMLCEVFDPVTGSLKEDTIEYGIIRDVRTFLNFFKKVRLPSEDDEFLHQKAVAEFHRCDDVASQVVIPDRHHRIIDHVGRTILLTLHKKDFEHESIYRHGPGAVQEGYKGNQKWSSLYDDIRDNVRLPDWFGYTNFSNIPCWDQVLPDPDSGTSPDDSTGREPGCVGPARSGEGELYPFTVRDPLERRSRAAGVRTTSQSCLAHAGSVAARSNRCSGQPREASARLISVLKNSTSRRTITIEPYLRQYLQQGLNSHLREAISECAILRNCLALTDQQANQRLALEGSLTGDWATIDLKSASDLLSISLVEAVFGSHPDFVRMLMDCRSPYYHLSGSNETDVKMGKFAGMGNATTFPVQSICFAVIGISAILDDWGVRPSYKNVKRASRLVRVYGDDIIVRSNHAHQVVRWLHDCGLTVNVKKSFLEGNFRESCGVDAFRGVDVTPLYIRHWPHHIDESPSVCAHLVSLSNHLWLQGLYKTSDYLKEKVEEYLGIPLPLVSSQSGSLGWHTRQEWIQPHKWCKHTHQFMTRTFALKPVKSRDRLDGWAALLKCLTTPLLGRDKDHLERTARRYQNRLVRRWVPSYSYDGLNLQV